jgi:hypothetical protein
MAAIQLRKILAQNSKLIKGYHLLALIQIKEHEWNRARRTLRKAARIDKTNTTTLRFLKEIDEQTGVSTRLEQQNKKLFRGRKEEESDSIMTDIVVPAPAYKEHTRISYFFTLALGFAAGAAAFWFLVMPAIRQGIYKEANEQIVQYSEYLSSQGIELTKAQDEAEQSVNSAEQMTQQIELERETKESYENLLIAYSYLQQNDADSAYLSVREVNVDLLSEDALKIYNTITDRTGVPVPTQSPQEEESDSDSGYEEEEDSGETTSYEEESYEYGGDDYESEEYYSEEDYSEEY